MIVYDNLGKIYYGLGSDKKIEDLFLMFTVILQMLILSQKMAERKH